MTPEQLAQHKLEPPFPDDLLRHLHWLADGDAALEQPAVYRFDAGIQAVEARNLMLTAPLATSRYFRVELYNLEQFYALGYR